MSQECFALLPRDGLSVKDGRGWYTSEVGRGHSHPWPLPTTVRGALRAAWGQDLMATQAGLRLSPQDWERSSEGLKLKRFLALRRPLGVDFERKHRMWPFPADAVLVGDGEHKSLDRLLPRRPEPGTNAATLGPDDDAAREALWHPRRTSKGKPATTPRFWSEAEMMAWLRGDSVTVLGTCSPEFRTDLHVAIDARRQAAEPSMLHSREVVELLRLERPRGHAPHAVEWALGLACEQPEKSVQGFPRGVLGLGGRRRLTDVEPLKADLFECPQDLARATQGLRLILATPACFERGWLPDGFERDAGPTPRYVGTLPLLSTEPVVLRAALVPRAQDVSAWDMVRRCPRQTRRWVPAGAVYFFEKRSGGDFTADELRALWLASWGGGHEEALGQVLPGVWQPSPEPGA